MAAKSRTYYIVEGTSEPQDFQLQDDAANLVGTGLTIGLVVYDNTGASVSSAPTVAWLSQADGTARVSSVNLLSVGEYHVRFSLTDGASKVGYCPNGAEADRWIVVRRYA
jgi:hypothetical protein